MDFAPHFQLHLNLHVNYYVDQTLPFSLRRPFMSYDPWQVNLSSLMEIELVGGFFLFGEMGFLDLNEKWPHLHAGASLGYSTENLETHFGFSMTSTFPALFNPIQRSDYQQSLDASVWNGFRSEKDSERVKMDFSLHPEFSLEYFF